MSESFVENIFSGLTSCLGRKLSQVPTLPLHLPWLESFASALDHLPDRKHADFNCCSKYSQGQNNPLPMVQNSVCNSNHLPPPIVVTHYTQIPFSIMPYKNWTYSFSTEYWTCPLFSPSLYNFWKTKITLKIKGMDFKRLQLK